MKKANYLKRSNKIITNDNHNYYRKKYLYVTIFIIIAALVFFIITETKSKTTLETDAFDSIKETVSNEIIQREVICAADNITGEIVFDNDKKYFRSDNGEYYIEVQNHILVRNESNHLVFNQDNLYEGQRVTASIVANSFITELKLGDIIEIFIQT